MKKTIIYLSIISIAVTALYSCKKSSLPIDNENAGILHPVTFNAGGFKTTILPVGINPGALKLNSSMPNTEMFPDSVKYLAYVLFNNSNSFIKSKTYRYDSAGFGTIKDSLAIGTYTAVFIASAVSFDENNCFYKTDKLYYSYSTLTGIPLTPEQFPPVLFKKVSFTVGSSGTTQPVVLNRVTAQLQVVIEDAIPANADYINVSVIGELGAYSYTQDLPISAPINVVIDHNPWPSTINNIGSSNIGAVNFTTTPISILNTVSPLKVTVKAYNSSGTSIAVKTIPNVTFQRNTKTILKGKLFTNASSGPGADIGFTTSYAADTVKVRY